MVWLLERAAASLLANPWDGQSMLRVRTLEHRRTSTVQYC